MATSKSEEHTLLLGEGNTLRAQIRLGLSEKFTVRFEFTDGSPELLLAKLQPERRLPPSDKTGKEGITPQSLPDASIAFQGVGLQFANHVRPRLQRYTPDQATEIAARWDSLPAASQHWTDLEIRTHVSGGELWVDGRFCGQLPPTRAIKAVCFILEPGGELRGAESFKRATTSRFLPLDISKIQRPGTMRDAVLTIPAGLKNFEGVPLMIAEGRDNADVGMAREMQGPRALETNENTSRTALDGMPESLHFSVPQKTYRRAWVLCAAERDPKKDPVFTARLTRFATSGRGGAIADTLVEVPLDSEKAPRGGKLLGAVNYALPDGEKVSSPLWLIPVDLKTGDILDLLAEEKDAFAAMKIGPYLDFEFLGKCGGLEVQNDHRRRPLKTSKSGVHIFAATLEVSGLEVQLRQLQPGNIFHNSETPETRVALRANIPGTYRLIHELRDVSGNRLRSKESRATLISAGAESEITIDLSVPDVGWYSMHLRVLDESNHPMMEHTGAFALLGEDTRKAGYDSPFGTWWFGGAHYATKDLSIIGPMLFKAGLRRIPVGWTKDTEADMAPWKLTLNQISWPFRLADLENWQAATERVEKLIREKVERFPHCEYIDVFHESFDNALPPELHGDAYVAKQPERESKLFELGVKGARFLREKFPHLKLVVGNSGGSAGTIAMLLRHGFPRDLIDYLGSETTGQTIAPEKLSIHTTAGIWILKETARTFGYDIPLTGCYEFTCRAERDLSPQLQAEWYTRDMLYGLAHRFPTISPGEIEDVGNAYYDSFYGAAGICQRRGLHYPKPAYVAMATLTKVLDSVKLVRQMPTGSSSAHSLEFQRGDKTIYALWTSRGECTMEMTFEGTAELESIDFYGKRRPLSASRGTVRITAAPAVCYLVANARASACVARERTFPRHVQPADATVIAGKNALSLWELGPEEPRMKNGTLRPGKFELRQVDDPEKGACLELELKRDGNIPEIVGEYASLKLKEPLPFVGEPHTMGIWVKGDSSGGRVYWELEDAKGERWISNGGYDGGDWGNQTSLDFEGWCYLTFPISPDSPANHLEPGRGLGQWRGNADGRLDLPLKLTGLYVETRRASLDITEMKPVKNVIRIQEVSALLK